MKRKHPTPKRRNVSAQLREELNESRATISMLAQQLADKREIIRRLTT